MRLDLRIHAVMTERFRRAGLSVPQCDVLMTLTEQEGISQQELAKRLYVTKGNISGLIDRLAAAGMVERRQVAADRRAHSIHLTPAGREAAQKGLQLQAEFVEATIAKMDRQQMADFNRLLVLLRDKVRDYENA